MNRKDKNFPHYSTRWFKPNVQTKVLHSEVLDAKFKMPVTVKALKTIAQWGGFDNYLVRFVSPLRPSFSFSLWLVGRIWPLWLLDGDVFKTCRNSTLIRVLALSSLSFLLSS